MRTLKSVLTVIGAVTVLVLAGNTIAFATTGHGLILGKANKAKQLTSLKRSTSGPALRLTTKSSAIAPLVVNGRAKVDNLNADLVDGLDAASLQTLPVVYRIPTEVGVTSFSVGFPGLAPGLYQASFSIVARMSVNGSTINCGMEQPGSDYYELMAYGSSFGASYSTTSASGIIDVRSSSRQLRCFVTGAGSPTATVDFDSPHQSQIVLTRVDASTDATASAARVAGRAAAGATR